MRGYSTSREDHLFNKGDWFASQDAWKKKLVATIEGMNGDELFNTSTTDLAKYYVSEFELDVPWLHSDEIVVDQRETQVDISQDRNRWIDDRSSPFHITGTSVDVDLPFSGTGSALTFSQRRITSTIRAPKLAKAF